MKKDFSSNSRISDMHRCLFNPVGYALAIDALQNPGPGKSSRIDLSTLCSEVATDGLTLEDVIATTSVSVGCAMEAEIYPTNKYLTEPAIMSYATSNLSSR